MIKILRRGAIENPWFYKIIMGGLAVAFMISMGWWGFSNQGEPPVAQVGEIPIDSVAYRRAYQNTARFYREFLKDKYDDKLVRKQVIDGLVDRALWLTEANRMGLMISDQTLRDEITKLPGFQNEGAFDAERYRRILAAERLTLDAFERQQRDEMLIEKAKELVKDAVALTPAEMEQTKTAQPNNPDPDRALSDALFTKKQKVLNAYTLALKTQASVQVKEELL
jgi:peptidyl-prolyl cis-trans isomerase D